MRLADEEYLDVTRREVEKLEQENIEKAKERAREIELNRKWEESARGVGKYKQPPSSQRIRPSTRQTQVVEPPAYEPELPELEEAQPVEQPVESESVSELQSKLTFDPSVLADPTKLRREKKILSTEQKYEEKRKLDRAKLEEELKRRLEQEKARALKAPPPTQSVYAYMPGSQTDQVLVTVGDSIRNRTKAEGTRPNAPGRTLENVGTIKSITPNGKLVVETLGAIERSKETGKPVMLATWDPAQDEFEVDRNKWEEFVAKYSERPGSQYPTKPKQTQEAPATELELPDISEL